MKSYPLVPAACTWLLLSGPGAAFPDAALPALLDRALLRFDASQSGVVEVERGDRELRMGSLHAFVVASLEGRSGTGTIIHTGGSNARLSIFGDGANFRLETSDHQYGRRVGAAVDDAAHLFEVAHFIDPALTPLTGRTAWPGEFRMNGALCGKFFAEAAKVPLDGLTTGWPAHAAEALKPGRVREILIFDTALSGDAARAVRQHLAEKWNLALREWSIPDDLPRLPELPVGPPRKTSSFGYYNESPESPDGRRLAYIVFDAPVNHQNPVEAFSLWTCSVDLREHRKVMDAPFPANLHNGAVVHWVDNSRIALGSDRGGTIMVVNADTGAVEFGPYSPGWPGGTGHNGKLLLHMIGASDLGPAGLYVLDTQSGAVDRLFTLAEFSAFHEALQWRGQADPARWRFVHGKYSTDGSHIAFTIHTGKGGGQHLFTARSDGSRLSPWGRMAANRGADKPLHFLWYDADTLFGVDQECMDGTPNNLFVKRWRLDGTYIETLAGPACHLGMSQDRGWFAGETFYYDNPVRLHLYRSGETLPAAVIFEHEGIIPTWIDNGHVNPSFSRDGRRVYYNRPVDNERVQAFACDISPLLGD
jgi:hypothetical protein